MNPYQRFVEARDFLLQHRSDYELAHRGYVAPALTTFNWALDFFDIEAQGNQAPALWVVGEDGAEQKISYAEMAARSNRAANFLRARGVRRGDRVLLMLPNRVELWDLMLAGIKLGAVMVPTSMLALPADRPTACSAAIGHVIAESSEATKFASLDGATGIAPARRPPAARLRRQRERRRRLRAGRRHDGARSAAAVFYFRHHRQAENGDAQP
jgi:acetyl-CoA synthetase